MAYRGFLAPGAKMGIGAPSPRRVRLATVEGAFPRYWGSGVEPQPPTLLGAFGCKWNPFSNSVNTIFNSACQIGKHRRVEALLLAIGGGSGAEPQRPTLLGAFGCKWNPFLNSVNTIFNAACQTGKRQRRSP